MADNLQSELVKADKNTVFVLGNGPSLRDVSLPALSDYATIGVNAAYRFWREIDWRPVYYTCLDLVVGLSHKEAIAELIAEGRIEKFLLRGNLIEALGRRAYNRRVVNFDALKSQIGILQPPAITTGSHAALWAASMGFRKVVLLGVDGRYKEFVKGAERRDGIELEIVKKADNPNYFFENYQQPGDRYNIPNPRPDLHIDAWRAAGAVLKKAGAAVYNGNAQSAVRCFPFVDLSMLLKTGAMPAPADEDIQDVTTVPGNIGLSPKSGGVKRFVDFVRANLLTCLAPAVVLAIALAFLVALDASMAVLFAFLAAGGLIWAAYILMFYSRHTVAQRFSVLQQEVDGLREWLSDLERLS